MLRTDQTLLTLVLWIFWPGSLFLARTVLTIMGCLAHPWPYSRSVNPLLWIWWLIDCVNLSRLCPTKLTQCSSRCGETHPREDYQQDAVERETKKEGCFCFFGESPVFAFTLDIMFWLPAQTLQPPDKYSRGTLQGAPGLWLDPSDLRHAAFRYSSTPDSVGVS